jgi:hypothetical protein
MFGSPEVSYHQPYAARDWLSILRTFYSTQNLQRKHRNLYRPQGRKGIGRTNKRWRQQFKSRDGTDQMEQILIFKMMMIDLKVLHHRYVRI